LAVDEARLRGIPSDAKLRTCVKAEILHVFGQSEFDIYIIVPPLKYVPNPMTIAWPWMELQAEEFPKMRNYKRLYEAEILCVFVGSELDIYIIVPPLKYVPTPVTIAHMWTDLQAGEFPQ
jgi:hypothetical protein